MQSNQLCTCFECLFTTHPSFLTTSNITKLPVRLMLVSPTPTPQRPRHQLRPEANRRVHERSFIRINSRSFPDEVSLHWLDELSSFKEFPEDEENGSHDDHGVVDKEVLDGPGREGCVAVAADDHDHPSEADPCLFDQC